MSDIVDRRGFGLICGLAYAATLLILVWTRLEAPAPLLAGVAALGLAAGGQLLRAASARRRGIAPAPSGERFLGAAIVILGLAAGAALFVQHRFDGIAADWEDLVSRREMQRVTELDRRVRRLIERSEAAAVQAAKLAAERPEEADDETLLGELERVRSAYRVAALAVFDDVGELRAWAGDHRGPLPVEAKRAGHEIIYAERPLFGYLYVSIPVEGRPEHALAAVLMQTGLALETGAPMGFAEEFARRTGARPYFGPGPTRDADWALVVDGDTLAHATFDPYTQAEWRAELGANARKAVVPLTLLAIVALSTAWLRRWRSARGATAFPLLGLTAALAIAPLGGVLGSERLFSPGLFLLPAPGEVSLGRFLAVLIPLAALTAVARPVTLEGRAGRIGLGAGALAVALGFPTALGLLIDGAAPTLLEGGPYLWAGLFPAALTVLTMVAALALPSTRPGPVRTIPVLAGLATTVLLALVIAVRWRLTRTIDPWMPALWAVPFALVATGVIAYQGRWSRLIRWLLAGWLAASVVVPYLWATEVQAKLSAAEREIATLGINPDPFLDYMLRQFAAESQRRHARGEDGVELLYRSWVASGLAREAYPARISLLERDRERVALEVGEPAPVRAGDPAPRDVLARVLERARGSRLPALEPAPRVYGASQVLAVPLPGDDAIVLVVRPRRSLAQPTILAPLFGAEPRPNTEFTLIPATHGQPVPRSEIEWIRTEEWLAQRDAVALPRRRVPRTLRVAYPVGRCAPGSRDAAPRRGARVPGRALDLRPRRAWRASGARRGVGRLAA